MGSSSVLLGLVSCATKVVDLAGVAVGVEGWVSILRSVGWRVAWDILGFGSVSFAVVRAVYER